MDDVTADERVLVDPELDRRLALDHLVLVPMVDPAELDDIEQAYWSIVPHGEQGIVLDYLRDDRALVRELAELMAPVWERVVPEVFERHYPVYTSFVVKHPGEDSSLYLHRDLPVDDEREHRTFSMWMPFTDTNPDLDNGPLAFVPGSEQIDYGGFGPNAVGLFSPYDRALTERLEPVAVPAGTAVVYDAKLLHASAPNRTGSVRLAVGCLLARRDRPVIQVMSSGRRHRQVHEVDRDYFINYAPADVARMGIPERYPVIDEYDEEPGVPSGAMLGPALQPLRGERVVIVPVDLEQVAGASHPLPIRPGPRPRHDRDLTVSAADLLPLGPHLMEGIDVDTVGPVGAVDLASGSPEGRAESSALLVVDAGSRVALTARRPTEVVVVECPAVRAGACRQGYVAELDLGSTIDLEPGSTTHLWNDGRGSLVVVVRSAAGLSTPRAD